MKKKPLSTIELESGEKLIKGDLVAIGKDGKAYRAKSFNKLFNSQKFKQILTQIAEEPNEDQKILIEKATSFWEELEKGHKTKKRKLLTWFKNLK